MLTELQNPHDKFFKETLSEVSTAKDFLDNYLPKNILSVVDMNILNPPKDSFINKELDKSFSDFLFALGICEREGYFYLFMS